MDDASLDHATDAQTQGGQAHGAHDHAAHDHAAHDHAAHDHGAHDHGGHDHGGHDHAAALRKLSPRKLWAVAGLNITLGVVQLIGALAFASVALLADTLHQAIDAGSLVISAIAVTLATRPPTGRRTFGWGRADALGGLISGLILVVTTAWLVYESIERLRDPAPVVGWGVIVLGVVGIVVNGGSALYLGKRQELSFRAARLHLLTDMGGSIAVVVAGVVVATTGWNQIDPIISLVISVAIIWATIRLLRHAADVLLDAAPTGVEATEVEVVIREVPGVTDVHHLHVWTLAPGDVAVTAHVSVDGTESVHATQERSRAIEAALAERFGITHTTLQVECHPCETPDHT